MTLLLLAACSSGGEEAAVNSSDEPASASLPQPDDADPDIFEALEDEPADDEPADEPAQEAERAAQEQEQEPERPEEETPEEPTEEVQPVDVEADDAGDGLFPTVVGATASSSDGASWQVNVTLSSEYDTAARYADAWRVLDGDDNELGIRVLAHDHANEQPFTRSTSVDIPQDLTTVFIEGRDQLNGWSGERFELTLTR